MACRLRLEGSFPATRAHYLPIVRTASRELTTPTDPISGRQRPLATGRSQPAARNRQPADHRRNPPGGTVCISPSRRPAGLIALAARYDITIARAARAHRRRRGDVILARHGRSPAMAAGASVICCFGTADSTFSLWRNQVLIKLSRATLVGCASSATVAAFTSATMISPTSS
jgi:hypothetical protein